MGERFDFRDAASDGAAVHRLRLADAHGWLTARERAPMLVEQGGQRAVRRGAWLAALLPTAYLFFDTPGPWTSRRGQYTTTVQRHLARAFALRARGAHRADDRAQLDARRDGDVVCARGQVRSRREQQRPVFCQHFIELSITGLRRAMHHGVVLERAYDFDLELVGGGRARVAAAASWLVGPAPSLEFVQPGDLAALWEIPESTTLIPPADKISHAARGDVGLEHGAMITVIGAKTRVVEPGASERLPRQEPWHPGLCASAASPLLILAESGRSALEPGR